MVLSIMTPFFRFLLVTGMCASNSVFNAIVTFVPPLHLCYIDDSYMTHSTVMSVYICYFVSDFVLDFIAPACHEATLVDVEDFMMNRANSGWRGRG